MSKVFKDYKEMKREDLITELTNLKKNLMSIRFQQSAGQLSQSHLFKQNRKQIAQVQTAIKQLELKNA